MVTGQAERDQIGMLKIKNVKGGIKMTVKEQDTMKKI